MKLHPPFVISARLAPALNVGNATLSFDGGVFVLDFPDGSEHRIPGFRFPQGRISGETDGARLVKGFAAVLSFLSACAESRAYGRRRYGDEMRGENSDLFPSTVGEWAESVSDELSMLAFEIEEAKTELIEA